MKVLLILVAGFALAAPTAASAGTAAKDPRVPALQRQVAALTTQVAEIRSHVQKQELAFSCFVATQLNIDLGFLNIFNAMFGQPNDPTHISDNGSCAAIGAPTPRRLAGVVSPFGTLPFLIDSGIAAFGS